MKRREGLEVRDEVSKPRDPEMFYDPTLVARTSFRVSEYSDRFVVHVDVGKMKPKEEWWTESSLYVGASQPMDVPIAVKLFADNLPQPAEFQLVVSIRVEDRVFDGSKD